MGPELEQRNIDCSFDLIEFRETRANLHTRLDEVDGLADRFASETAHDLVESARRDLADDLFRIVVVGEFSRGKSTFINAMLGGRVLPAAPYPVTTVLTCIRDGETHKVRLIYRDGKDEPILPERFAKIVAPPEPTPGDLRSQQDYEFALEEISKIERADLQYPSSLCRNGVEVVDTPGTNDINVVREQITYEFIPRADAIIFLLNALEPVTASEIGFLRDRVLKADIQRVFFVLNFADRLSTTDQSRVMERTRRELGRVVPEPRVFMVSSKTALRLRTEGTDGDLQQSGLPQFETALSLFLQQERTSIKLRKPAWRGIRACRELREHAIALSSAALEVDANELATKIKAVQPRIRQYQQLRDEQVARFRIEMSSALPEMQLFLRNSLYEIAGLAELAVLNYSGTFVRDRIMQAVEDAIAAKETALHSALNEMRKKALAEIYVTAANALEIERLNIERDVIAKLTPGNSTSETPVKIAEEALRPLSTAPAKGILQSIANGIAKVVRLFSPRIAYALEATINHYDRRGISKNVRIAYENRATPAVIDLETAWEGVATELARDLGKQADTRIRDLKKQLQQLLDEASDNEAKRSTRRQELHEISQQLAEIEKELRTLGGWIGTGSATA